MKPIENETKDSKESTIFSFQLSAEDMEDVRGRVAEFNRLRIRGGFAIDPYPTSLRYTTNDPSYRWVGNNHGSLTSL